MKSGAGFDGVLLMMVSCAAFVVEVYRRFGELTYDEVLWFESIVVGEDVRLNLGFDNAQIAGIGDDLVGWKPGRDLLWVSTTAAFDLSGKFSFLEKKGMKLLLDAK
ncbi:hypothetical protein Droror1_Dr00016876 [Drosera rotundifolia]